ncbi:hypothetical protein N7539_001234 [Penicillium diatomitis]|uniref:Uncharacterized protein n=1 Tax=Penicillium diatomitis TaxID=2819901 RepID=A0A9X0C2X8_9EURO|nr:uncharacterized protein N7539_001234 [Penicillium diatomitis]KAJ5496118.1 hypothetical protein N7539_001234 [Penicillium diatomitis]
MTDDSAPQGVPTCDPSGSTADESSFRFTPIKALRAIPRLWERKPATPFKAGLKRKLWKRFQTSFSNMQTVESSVARDQDALQTAINTVKDSAYVRGVKRLCVATGETTVGNIGGSLQSKGPFLETKWESEASGKRRKLPDTSFKVYSESASSTAKSSTSESSQEPREDGDADGDLTMTTSSPIIFQTIESPARASIESNVAPLVQSESGSAEQRDRAESESSDANDARKENSDVAPTPTKIVRNASQIQKGSLVRSALRSSLDGEDTLLLNDFLSKAMAKRAAKASLKTSQESVTAHTTLTKQASSSPCSKDQTPRSRRVLEDRDTNSPSPVKVKMSPSKIELVVGDAVCETKPTVESLAEEPEESGHESPACRRSARVKAPSAPIVPVRETIALRRAKGTEFVFLQRTEAQELALATRRNTKHNRGDSVMPKYALQAMAQEQSSGSDGDTREKRRPFRDYSASRQPSSKPRKSVTWNEERMVEYEGDLVTSASAAEELEAGNEDSAENSHENIAEPPSQTIPNEDQAEEPPRVVSRSVRSKRSREAEAEGALSLNHDKPASVVAPVSTTPRSRRVRRLGDSAMASGTVVKTGSGRVSKPPTTFASSSTASNGAPSTPTKPRRKLVPKSPSTGMLSTTLNKAGVSGASGASHFASGIPTRSTSIGGSDGMKRKTSFQTNAGCTPMPKRVRARS